MFEKCNPIHWCSSAMAFPFPVQQRPFSTNSISRRRRKKRMLGQRRELSRSIDASVVITIIIHTYNHTCTYCGGGIAKSRELAGTVYGVE